MNMTPAQMAKYQAALAGGATIEAALLAAGVVATAEQIAEMTTAAAEFKAEAKAEADALATAAAAKKMADEAETARQAALAGATGKDASAIDLLKSQLVTSQAAERSASIELATLKATTTTATANHDGLLAIARKGLANMLVPMGGSAASADAMDATAVIAEHTRVEKLFLEKFPVGRVSKPGVEETDQGKGVDDAFAQRLALQNKNRKEQ